MVWRTFVLEVRCCLINVSKSQGVLGWFTLLLLALWGSGYHRRLWTDYSAYLWSRSSEKRAEYPEQVTTPRSPLFANLCNRRLTEEANVKKVFLWAPYCGGHCIAFDITTLSCFATVQTSISVLPAICIKASWSKKQNWRFDTSRPTSRHSTICENVGNRYQNQWRLVVNDCSHLWLNVWIVSSVIRQPLY